MLSIMRYFSDHKEHTFREVVEGEATTLNLTDEERTQKLPSGSQNMFDNRVGWARINRRKAGLLDPPSRGNMIITNRGLSVLAQKLERIDAKCLKQFPEFLEFYATKITFDEEVLEQPGDSEETPEEILELAYQKKGNRSLRIS